MQLKRFFFTQTTTPAPAGAATTPGGVAPGVGGTPAGVLPGAPGAATTPAAGGVAPGAATTPAEVVPPVVPKITSSPDKPVTIPPGTDNTALKITIVPLDPTKPVVVKVSTKICIKESSESFYLFLFAFPSFDPFLLLSAVTV